MARHDLIVIGGSAGGVDALLGIVRGLPNDLPAAICVVIHTSAAAPSLLPVVLNREAPFRVVAAGNGTTLEVGTMYVAPPDCHLLIEPGRMRLSHGPKENHVRPAINPLFRSAALHYGARVIGVILSGALDDGTSGLWAVKKRGGIAVVQDPRDALVNSMPNSARASVAVDYEVGAAQMGGLLARLAGRARGRSSSPLARAPLRDERSASADLSTSRE